MNTITRRLLPLALSAAAATVALGTVGAAGANAASAPAAQHSSVVAASSTDTAAYAYKHACTDGQLRVQVSYDKQLGTTKRLIAVTDTSRSACGLSYFPVVSIDNSATIHARHGKPEFVQPAVPGGLGGAPYYALYAGHTAYAVVDLDPSHATAGASRVYNELAVIANDNLPNADTIGTKLVQEGGHGNPYVKSPFLGLYESSIADAAKSAVPPHKR
ncbi:DUF4232 domain-containing protein [Streptacidiphilus sp. 4-A2]|nr:DUF4232 domain-containing protein [Streptacidiphilus sp. 4-A2]